MKNFILFLVLAFGISLQAQTYSLPNLKYQYTDYEPDIDALTMLRSPRPIQWLGIIRWWWIMRRRDCW